MSLINGTIQTLAQAVVVVATVTTLGFSSAAFGADASTHAAAVRFVEDRKIGANMVQMAKQAIINTTTYHAMLASMGTKASYRAFAELDAAQPKYQPRWNAALAAAYAKHFSAEELDSLRREGRSSPYARKMSQSVDSIGRDVKVQAEPILVEYVTTALHAAYPPERRLRAVP